MRSERHVKVKEIELPYFPHPVHLKDLDEDLRLIPIKTAKILAEIDLPEGNYLYKKKTNEERTILHVNGEFYAVYQKKSLGSSDYNSIHPAQNIVTGKWIAIKKSYDLETEDVLSQKYGLLIKSNTDKPSYFLLKDQTYLLLNLYRGITLKKTYLAKLSSHQVISLLISMVSELQVLHGLSIRHADLHDQNILLDLFQLQTVVIDLGSAIIDAHPRRIFAEIITLLKFVVLSKLVVSNPKFEHPMKPPIKSIVDEMLKIHVTSPSHLTETYTSLLQSLFTLRESLSKKEKTYHVEIVDINKGINPTTKYRSKFVCLINTNSTATMRDYLAVKQSLEKAGAMVHDKLYQHPSKIKLALHLKEQFKITHPDCYFELHDRQAHTKFTLFRLKRVRCQTATNSQKSQSPTLY